MKWPLTPLQFLTFIVPVDFYQSETKIGQHFMREMWTNLTDNIA
jgi:hypothetical protein